MFVPISRLTARWCFELAGFFFPRTTLFALKVPLHWGQGSAQWSENAFLLCYLISRLSDCCSRWSDDSLRELRDFRSVGHEGSRSACLLLILLPGTSVRVHEYGGVWLVLKKDWVAQLCWEEFVHADVNSIKGYTWETQSARYFLLSLSTGLINHRTVRAKVQVFM